jgi:hypothetical protein
MSFRLPTAVLLVAFAAVAMLAAMHPTRANQSGEIGTWRILHQLERKALRDYEHHISNSDVLQRGQILMNLARSDRFAPTGQSCGWAAAALSYMVSGYYFSAQRLEVAFDWHHYRGHYLERRSECLQDLGLDATTYPLPYWFVHR